MKDEQITTQSQPPLTTSKDLQDIPLLVMAIHHADIIDEKKAWFNNPIEAKEADVVGSWFALLIAGQIGLFIAMDVNVYRKQGGNALRIMRERMKRRNTMKEEKVDKEV